MPRLSGTGQVYRLLANDVKARIEAGEFRPGKQLPAEESLAHSYGVSRGTARRAIKLLEYERILEVRHGHGTFVRQRVEPDIVELAPGMRVLARMPTLEEQQELEIRETTPVLVVVDADGSATLYPADQVVLHCP